MRLRVTIGPVQELVRQSRRTRDLWASSFLLSYLSGWAMHGAVSEGGRIILPSTDGDPLYEWIGGKGTGDPPMVGSLPNRFEIDTSDPEPAAKAARKALGDAWTKIYEAVWRQHLAPVADQGRGTEGIFRRQVASFWEIQWVAAAGEEQMKGLLERRKAWRSRIPTVEPGDKCVVMPELQELSGFIRAKGEKVKQEKFWQAVKKEGHLHDAELRENERLSGVALVKRLYPREEVAKSALGWNPQVSRWRSTVYVAAIPWIDEVIAKSPDACREYAQRILAHDRRAKKEIADRSTRRGAGEGGGSFASLDANYFFVDAIDNPEATLERVPMDADVRGELRDQLEALYKSGGDNPVGPPASFYALLLMDGDHVGHLLAELGGPAVSAALARFTKQVGPIVEERQGYAIYAGGDDVLAMLPVTSALPCARALREAYQASFRGDPRAKTSAAVVFAHIREPLQQVLEEAHHLLDDVAKDRNGRDSIAVCLQRRGDYALEWTTTWDDPDGRDRLAAVQALRDMWRDKGERRRAGDARPLVAGEISTGLIYRVRDLMGMLCGWERWEPGTCLRISGADPVALLAAEIRRAYRAAGVEEDDDQRAREGELAERLLYVCHPAERNDKARTISLDRKRIGMDGALLALFLSTDGKERDHGAMGAPR